LLTHVVFMRNVNTATLKARARAAKRAVQVRRSSSRKAIEQSPSQALLHSLDAHHGSPERPGVGTDALVSVVLPSHATY
jgi:hypothetical protein